MSSLSKLIGQRQFILYNLGSWISLFIVETAIIASFNIFNHSHSSFPVLVIWIGSKCITYWILSYAVFELFIFTGNQSRLQFIIYHLSGSLLFAVVHILLFNITDILFERLFLGPDFGMLSELPFKERTLYFDMPADLFIYWLMILILSGIDYYQRYHEAQLHFIEADRQYQKSRLNTLKIQLQPHFLFNTFNTITMMIRNNKNTKAIQMISDLSDMLRYNLQRDKKQFITLREEIALIEKYLSIESERYGERLKIEWENDLDNMNMKIPVFSLQPAVENAFKHGISKSPGESLLKITLKKKNDRLLAEIFNSPSFLSINWDVNLTKGLGLSNTIERLSGLYKNDFKIIISNKNNGVAVELNFPIDPGQSNLKTYDDVTAYIDHNS